MACWPIFRRYYGTRPECIPHRPRPRVHILSDKDVQLRILSPWPLYGVHPLGTSTDTVTRIVFGVFKKVLHASDI